LALLIVAVAQSWPAAAPTVDETAPLAPGIESPAEIGLPGDSPVIAGVDTADTDRRISFWQRRVAANPRDDLSWTNLGDLFDLKGRQTGDISNYTSAQAAYATALDIAPRSTAALTGAARIDATLHDFAGALSAATAVLELDPGAYGALGIVFDSSLELGDIANARHALELLAARVDSPAVMSRQARLAFITGDTAAALALSAQAADFAADAGEPGTTVALYEFIAAEYALLAGDLDAAAAGYRAALNDLPGYPAARFGLGRVDYALGDLTGAIANLEAATATLPRPDMLAFLGDLYMAAGRHEDAFNQYATVDFIHGLAAGDGARVYDREYVNFLSDHGRDPGRAVALATTEALVRQDVYGYDALAWALHAAGDGAHALAATRLALADGTQDARLLIHAGLIELTNGLSAEGRAHLDAGLALNPSFSPLVIQAARAALAQ
jgi:tetratricopeptide (TPR) repeat protein